MYLVSKGHEERKSDKPGTQLCVNQRENLFPFPGHSFAPLSLLPFSTQQLPDTLPPYTPALDLTQLGPETPISAIPFASYTPADVLERLRRAELGRIVEWHGLRIDLERDLDVQMVRQGSPPPSPPVPAASGSAFRADLAARVRACVCV